MQSIIGEGFGLIAIVATLFVFSQTKRDQILKVKFACDALWMLNFLCLGGYTGAVLNLVGMARETVFYFRDRNKFASRRFWLPVFMALTLVSPVLECVSAGQFLPMTLLPALGSMLTVIGLYQRNPNVTRYIAFVAQPLWLVYGIYLLNISAIVSNSFAIVSAIIGTVRSRKK